MSAPLIGLRGRLVRLVPPDRALHLENALRWINDPDVSGTIKLNLGATRAEEERFFDRIESRDGDNYHWAIVIDADERHIGFKCGRLFEGDHAVVNGFCLVSKGTDQLG